MEKTESSKLLHELCSQSSETEWLEFKINNANPDEIGEYIAALANSACLHDRQSAYLIFGIADKTHEIVGTTFQPRACKVGNENLENWLARLLNPRVDFKIVEVDFDHKKIVMFVIDSAHNRPIAFKNTTFIRVGSYKKKLSDYPEKERKIWHKGNHVAFEKEIALKNISSDEVLQFLTFTDYYDLMKLPPSSNTTSVLDKFQEEKFIKKNGSHFNILNLGAILFAKNLDAFEDLSRKSIRIITYKGSNKLETIKEKVIAKGYAVGIREAIDYLNDQLPRNEKIEQVLRREVKMFPELAIRELVVNALMHQDFSVKGAGPTIEIFDGRIEITNPGVPLIDTLRFIDSSPESRNELLAKVMRRMNLCEERGSGIDKTIGTIETYQLPAPDFIKGEHFLRVILYSHKELKLMDKSDKIRACYQHCVLKFVSGDFMTNKSLRERFNISEKNYPMVSRIIADAIEANMIKDYDMTSKSKKYARYVPFWV